MSKNCRCRSEKKSKPCEKKCKPCEKRCSPCVDFTRPAIFRPEAPDRPFVRYVLAHSNGLDVPGFNTLAERGALAGIASDNRSSYGLSGQYAYF